jgi:hypothetical protein
VRAARNGRNDLAAPTVTYSEEREQPMTKVLITGGVGFVGSQLAERLLGEDDEMVVDADKLPTP